MYHLCSVLEFDLSLDNELPLANTYGLVKDGFLCTENSKEVVLVVHFSPAIYFTLNLSLSTQQLILLYR